MNNNINTPSPINRSFTTIDERDDFTPIFRTPPLPSRRGVRRPRISGRNMPAPLQPSPLLITNPPPHLPRRNRNPFSIRTTKFPPRKTAGKNKRKSRKRKITLKNNSFKNKKRKL